MKRFINWVLAIGAMVGMFYGVGLIVPRTVVHKAHAELESRPEDLYNLVADVAKWPSWHPDVSYVSPHGATKDHWDVTMKDGRSYEIQMVSADRGSSWVATYTLSDTVCRLNYTFGWKGLHGRIYLSRSDDTSDPWRRSLLFLWNHEQSTAVAILDGLAEHLGEETRASE